MNNWTNFLKQEEQEEYYIKLMEKVNEARNTETVYPSIEEMYSCFDLCPYEDVKVVIIGQDPYHGEGQAHGLSFSVKPGIKVPPSLKNIYKELKTDLGIDTPDHGYLVSWAKQGVLMMNTSWTVTEGKAGSHKKFGWAKFTQRALDVLNNYDKPLVFILWGNHAIDAAKGITNPKHLLLKGIHPSPLAGGGFFGSKPFSQTNAFLEKVGRGAIDWTIPEVDASLPVAKQEKKQSKPKTAPKAKVEAKTKQAKVSEELPVYVEESSEGMKVQIALNRFKLKENGKWFLINENNEKLSSTGYDRLIGGRKELIRVKEKGLMGLLDIDGNLLHKSEYLHISKYRTLKEIGDVVQIFSKDGIGLINIEGKEIIPPKFYEYKVINDNCYTAKIKHYGDTGVYDKNGKELIPPKYHRIEDAGDGYFKVYDHSDNEYKYSLFSPEGKQLTGFDYGEMITFHNGFIRVSRPPERIMEEPGVSIVNPNKLWSFLDRDGKEQTKNRYEDLGDFNDGLAPAAVNENGRIGFINTKGELVIEQIYQSYTGTAFENGICKVGNADNKMGIINTKGEVLIPFIYDVIANFKNGVAYTLVDEKHMEDYIYIDLQHNCYYPKWFESENKWACVDEQGKLAPHIPINFEREIIEDSLNFELNGKTGFYDANGKVFIDPIYEDTSAFFWGGIAAAKLNGKWGFINRENKVIVPFEYEKACFIMKGYGTVQKKDETVMLVGEKGILTTDSFVYIGYKYHKFNKELDRWQESPGGKWLWNIFSSEWQFYDLIDNEHSIATVYEEFSLLKSSVEYERDYFEFSAKEDDIEKYRHAVIADTGEIIYPKNVKDDVIMLAKGETYDFNRVPNNFLLEAKIKGVKAKMNENFRSAFDDYYLNDYHSKVYEYVGRLQNRFYRSLSAAVFEWIFWRTYEAVSPYMNMEIVFQKIEALYISAYDDDLLDGSKMSFDISYYSVEAEKLDLDETLLLEIEAVSEILNYIEKVYQTTYIGHEMVSVVVFARMVLSGAKKKLFNEWLDAILVKARPLFEIDFYPSWHKAFYDSAVDDFVPREFFFDKNYQYTPENGEKLITAFVERIKKEGNYFLK